MLFADFFEKLIFKFLKNLIILCLYAYTTQIHVTLLKTPFPKERTSLEKQSP